MQQSSIGRQGQQNQGPNMNININNQTQPQRRPVGLTFPIQEGFQGGQARINDDTESDAGSLLYDNNFAGIQATPCFQQPALSENTRDHSLPSIFPVQSASGCSGVSMNIPSGGHLRPLQSYNEELVEPGVVVDLQRLRGMLKQRHGESKYHKDVQNCMRSFQQALFSEDDASQYAIQLLYYLGESGLKCLDCKEIHNIGTVFRHKESCSVHICFQEILNAVGNQDTRQSNGAITNDPDQISDQRQSVSSLVPYSIGGDSITMESMLPLERIELGQQEERVARGINDGATGGVSQAGAEDTLYKAAYLPPSSFHSCSESRSFMQGFTTAPGPISEPNQVVHLPPGVPESGVNRPYRRLETSERQQFHHVQPQNYLADAGLFDIDSTLLAMGFTKEQIQGAIKRFRKVNGNEEYTTRQLIEILFPDENQEGNLMNQAICGACSRREVGVSQFECGHIVCRKCAAPNVGDPCKICGKQVVKVVLFDAATLKK